MNLAKLSDLTVYAASVVELVGSTYFLARDNAAHTRFLGVAGDVQGFAGTDHAASGARLCPLTPDNAAALRARLSWLRPAALKLRTSAGFGDRLGMATPGHVQAVRETPLAPIFAQQSVRENARTGRTPQQVMDDAMWGVFQAGWQTVWGADADHLKTPNLLDAFVTAGYSFYTVDPGDHVDGAAHTDEKSVLLAKVRDLPWETLDSSLSDIERRYRNQTFMLEGLTLTFDEETLLRAAAKYGRAVAHVVVMYRRLTELMGSRPFDFEVSVDETDTPTSIHEHFFIAGELRRLGVTWVSLAPRFVGRFEKGVDYIGDLAALETNLAGHSAVMRHFGGYKLSLHSGSDKFSVYPLAASRAGRLVHLKTAGTSYLEALRVLALVDPGAFRTILDFGRGRYETDRATYHVSAELSRVPVPDSVSDAELPGLLDQFDTRQVLHVTFGSALEQFGAHLKSVLAEHETQHYDTLARHFKRHLEPFC